MNGIIKETKRLFIRPMKRKDYPAWLHSFQNRKPSQYKYDPGIMDMSICTEAWFQSLVDKHKKMAEDDEVYVFGIFRKDDGAHIGNIDFSTLLRMNFQWACFGYTVHNQYFRQGDGSEAVKAAFEIAFEHLNYQRIEAHINLDNHPSIKLAESAGMSFECVRQGFIYEDNQWTDHLVYTIQRS
ncbi:GNAT family N-acetyltransferase [Corticicoccus populi]|uniref:GNAT family N-acetyltransferase n=1 Tax=Corticicoccus populi TaxID=1812821 RepID=A0ABW5WVF3_9STAP